jgi:Kef-type K+ transport system membrane component KefB
LITSPALKSLVAAQTFTDLLAWPVIAKAANSDSANNPIAKYVLAVALFSARSLIPSKLRLFETVLRNIFDFSLGS